MEKKVKYGIIGVGNMGASHIRFFNEGKLPELELTAVADINPERLEWIEDDMPEIKTFSSASELIGSGLCEAVLIATPHYAHPPLAMEALGAGLHVFIEKPAGVFTKQVREMNEFAAKSDKVFAIMYNQRTNPLYIKIRELVKSGVYGEMRRFNWIITDWFRTQSYYNSGGWRATWAGEGGGVLINQCPHNLDLWQWICGMPSKVRAFCHEGKWHDIEVEDDVTIYAEYENGATGVFVTTTGDCPGTNRLEITLDGAKIVCEDDNLQIYELDEKTSTFCATSPNGFGKAKGKFAEVDYEGENPQHVGVLNAFAAHILRGETLVANGEEGINGLTISNAAHLSSWLDRAVTLPLDEELFLSELNKKIAGSKEKAAAAPAKAADLSGTY
ncbi:MAG: Gfo/Idh/MocA family oxidoreductase [Oscillospiraceae bacterium]|jgi:predicted dehydrogenase|nr:Gfo/Idh/MocA family oxidoreductase [Oscillospiraceae bacterium]